MKAFPTPLRNLAFTFLLASMISPGAHQVEARSTQPASLANPDSLPDLVEGILPSVVNISAVTVARYRVTGMEELFNFWGIPMEREHRSSSLGSGFILDKEGYVVTNNHVIDGASEVIVTLSDKSQFQARLVGQDPKLDVALLQIRDDKGKVPGNLAPVQTTDSDKVRIAESVLAIGNPFGLQHTVTMGIISAKNRTIGLGPFDNFLQTDAPINPGNSGGPLFNFKGEVIGINTLIFSKTGQSGGLGFAIPINEALRIIPMLKKFKRVPRPWLGILGEPMNKRIQRYYGLATESGVLIYNMIDSGPADAAGMKTGDVILEANGTKVLEPLDVERELGKLKPTDRIKIKLLRRRQALDLQIQLKELPTRLENLPQGII